MAQIIAVLGQAGTGKTTWLMQKAVELAPRFMTAEHHSLLAITRMHGARRRLQTKLSEVGSSINFHVTTIDGLALSVLNRWRTALGHSKPIQPVSSDVRFADTIFGTEAGFAHVATASSQLLGSKTVGAIIGQTYPLVVIDEFQDCHGPLLDFVTALSSCTTLVVAADDFQLLDGNVNGCPAVEWVREPGDHAVTECTELTTCHRTSVSKAT